MDILFYDSLVYHSNIMTKVSRYGVEPERWFRFQDNFWTTITLLESKSEIKEFLQDLLTHTELKMFIKRLQIAKMLLAGYKYDDIKRYVKATHQTISGIANIVNSEERLGLKRAVSYLYRLEAKQGKQLEESYDRLPSLKKFVKGTVLDTSSLEQATEILSRKISRKSSVK